MEKLPRMTKLAILTAKERNRFDSPPVFNQDARSLHFQLSKDSLQIVQELRSPTNKIGFLLQLGYFRANGKFYTTEQFKQADIKYVIEILGLPEGDVDLSTYQKKIPNDHRKKILDLL